MIPQIALNASLAIKNSGISVEEVTLRVEIKVTVMMKMETPGSCKGRSNKKTSKLLNNRDVKSQ